MSIRDGVHSGWCPFGIVSIRDGVHLGLCPSGMAPIRDRVQDPYKTVLDLQIRFFMTSITNAAILTLNHCLIETFLEN